MAWDGAPDGWLPPAEAKAAEESAAVFERERAASDARTRTIADAIAFGFDRVAMAIVAAAGDDARDRLDRMNEPDGLDEPPPLCRPCCGGRTPHHMPGCPAHGRTAEYQPGDDPDIDDLLEADGDEDGQHPDG